MPTIRDVAQAADVWAATVSHYINETRFVSDLLRSCVLTTIARLCCQLNALTRGLRHKHAHTLGPILPHSAGPFTTEITRRIGRASFAQSYGTILGNTDHAALVNVEEGISKRDYPKPITARVNRSRTALSHPKEDLKCLQSAIP